MWFLVFSTGTGDDLMKLIDTIKSHTKVKSRLWRKYKTYSALFTRGVKSNKETEREGVSRLWTGPCKCHVKCTVCVCVSPECAVGETGY